MLPKMLVLVVLLSVLAGCATSEKVGEWLKPAQQGGGGGGEAVGSFLPEPWRTPATAGLGLLGTLLAGRLAVKERKKSRVLAKGIAVSGSRDARKAVQEEARKSKVSGPIEELAAEFAPIKTTASPPGPEVLGT